MDMIKMVADLKDLSLLVDRGYYVGSDGGIYSDRAGTLKPVLMQGCEKRSNGKSRKRYFTFQNAFADGTVKLSHEAILDLYMNKCKLSGTEYLLDNIHYNSIRASKKSAKEILKKIKDHFFACTHGLQ
jgi:hypothetical protein